MRRYEGTEPETALYSCLQKNSAPTKRTWHGDRVVRITGTETPLGGQFVCVSRVPLDKFLSQTCV